MVREGNAARRSILHVDLDPFFVSVERSLDPSLKDRPVVVGGGAGRTGIVAAASAEARAPGVRAGQSLAAARRLCPEAVFRQGDLDAYARVSEDVTAILLAASRRVERPSADEAYVDLTRERPGAPTRCRRPRPSRTRSSAGWASTPRSASPRRGWPRASPPRGRGRAASGRPARLRGLVPGAPKPVSFLPDLPPHIEAALERAGF